MSKSSIKKSVIQHLAAAATLDKLRGNKLILFTAGGIVTGTPSSKDLNAPVKGNEDIVRTIAAVALETDNGGEKREPENENDGFFLLDNVQILASSGHTTKIAQMIIFYDQITGVTIGPMDIN